MHENAQRTNREYGQVAPELHRSDWERVRARLEQSESDSGIFDALYDAERVWLRQ